MAKRRCTRREKAEEIADFLFVNGTDKKGHTLVLMDDNQVLGRWSEPIVAGWIEGFLWGWKPTTAARKKKPKARRR